MKPAVSHVTAFCQGTSEVFRYIYSCGSTDIGSLFVFVKHGTYILTLLKLGRVGVRTCPIVAIETEDVVRATVEVRNGKQVQG